VSVDRPVRVLIADDHALFAKTLETILDSDERLEVVGHADTGEQAVERAAALAPDVVVMDITMPVVDGLEATRRIRERSPGVCVVILTQSDLPADSVRAEKAGAVGYVPKGRAVRDLRSTILAAVAR